jgi:hypothetical protein
MSGRHSPSHGPTMSTGSSGQRLYRPSGAGSRPDGAAERHPVAPGEHRSGGWGRYNRLPHPVAPEPGHAQPEAKYARSGTRPVAARYSCRGTTASSNRQYRSGLPPIQSQKHLVTVPSRWWPGSTEAVLPPRKAGSTGSTATGQPPSSHFSDIFPFPFSSIQLAFRSNKSRLRIQR